MLILSFFFTMLKLAYGIAFNCYIKLHTMDNLMNKIIFISLLSISILLTLSCSDYAEPLASISERIGTYQNEASQYTVTVDDEATSISVRIPDITDEGIIATGDDGSTSFTTYTIETIGPQDQRLDYFYISTAWIHVVFDAEDYSKLYLYTNATVDDISIAQCIK